MARRIAGAVLALVTVLLAVLAVPLGLLTAGQDSRAFRFDTAASAATLANVAEERLGDHVHGSALSRSVRRLARAGDQVAVYDAAGRLIASTSGPLPGAGLVTRPPSARAHRSSRRDRLVVTAPVVPDTGAGMLGTVVLSRSTSSLDHQVTMLWTLIAIVCAAGLVVAGVMTAGLARWASRPLAALADAADRLGGGALSTRAEASSGPPEVRHLGGAFNTMASRLESLVRGHQMMMADVSHQVRTPLAALRLRLDLLAQDADEVTAAELAGAQGEIARLARLVNGLVAVARAESVTVSPVPVRVDEAARDRITAWRPAAEERGVTLDGRIAGPLTACAGDGYLEQILDNLIANALDALEHGGTIRIGAAAAGHSARITVADNGRGMSHPQQAAAFRRFASGTAGGGGLGLAIVDRLAAASGGSAELSDTPGGGLTVTIRLPLASPRHSPRRPGGGMRGQAAPH